MRVSSIAQQNLTTSKLRFFFEDRLKGLINISRTWRVKNGTPMKTTKTHSKLQTRVDLVHFGRDHSLISKKLH